MKKYKGTLFIIVWFLPFFSPLLLQISGYEFKSLGISETYYGVFAAIWMLLFIFLGVIFSKNRDRDIASIIVDFFVSIFIR